VVGMGIKGLTKTIGDNAPGGVSEHDLGYYFGRKVAIDASMCMYQFLVAVRIGENTLADDEGQSTSHLAGMFFRTIRLCEAGVKPCYVFDGKPPELKGGELAKRLEKRAEAEVEIAKAKEAGDQEALEKFSRRTVKVTKEQNVEVQELLSLMGIPWVLAASEAEATAAAMAKAGTVWAVASEDTDTMTFGTPVFLRQLMAPASKKLPVLEFDIRKVLEELRMTQDQFIDLSILLGCDYCERIPGIGPVRAVSLIREHGSIEAILQNENIKGLPEGYAELAANARRLFTHPEVTDPATIDLKWRAPDEEGVVKFLTGRGFQESRIRSGLDRLRAAKAKGGQNRLESFFGPVTVVKKAGTSVLSTKGKGVEKKGGKGVGKGKAGYGGKR